jgi:hypothetical protein
MTETGFWNLLGSLPSMLESSPQERAEQLRQRLIGLPDVEIAAFDRHFENHISGFYRQDILQAATRVLGGPPDEETFFNLACGVICLGSERYHQMLATPHFVERLAQSEIDNMAEAWMLYYVADDRLMEFTDVFEDEALPADMPQLIQRPKLEGLVRTRSVRPKDFPVGSPWDWL